MIPSLEKKDVLPLVELAIEEDIAGGDVTSGAIFGGGQDVSTAEIIAKENGIFCGGDVILWVYDRIAPGLHIEVKKKEGGPVARGERAAVIKGNTAGILLGERICLNFLQRMCGIATMAGKIVSLLEGTGIQVLDTRKTLPGFRKLDKYSVAAGGGTNHRMGLFDMVMIKDNHIKAAGSISEAVKKIRLAHGKKYKVEVETVNLEEVQEAVDAGADIIMLDNMDRNNMIAAVKLIDGRAKIEISGNMTPEKIQEIRDVKVDYISIGALTHSVKAFDLSMKFIDGE